MEYIVYRKNDELYHHGIKGQRWGIRRFQNEDGSLTSEGKTRYGSAADYATPTAKEQKAYYKNISKALQTEGSLHTKREAIAKQTPEEILNDLKPLGKKYNEAQKKYAKNYESEMEKCLKDEKKLKAFSNAVGYTDTDSLSSLQLKARFLIGYAYGMDVLGRIGHTTDSLTADKKAYKESDTKLYGEVHDYTKKLLGKYGETTLTTVAKESNGYYRWTGLARMFVHGALRQSALAEDAKTIDSSYRLAKNFGIDKVTLATAINNDRLIYNQALASARSNDRIFSSEFNRRN